MPEETGPKTCPFRVGYALPTRKNEAFMTPSFISYAKQHSIDFIPIDDVTKPLTDIQPPLDCVIHKFYGPEWDNNLETFSVCYPNTAVIDSPASIQRLHNRISMLEPVKDLNFPKLNVPNQLLVQDSESLEPVQQDHSNILRFPIMVKPLLADGSSSAHDMLLVLTRQGLTKVTPPVVLQQFVNHGGVMFKVYVAGDYVTCVKRSSLPDVSNEMIEKISLESGGVISFSKISGEVVDGDNSGEEVKMPAAEFVEEVARGLRVALGLRLFNFDMIRDGGRDGDHYLVVDINYFPGYEKLPGFESVMTDFLLDIKKLQNEKKMGEKEIMEEDKTRLDHT